MTKKRLKVLNILIIIICIASLTLSTLSLFHLFNQGISQIITSITLLFVGLQQINIKSDKEDGNSKLNRYAGIALIIVGSITFILYTIMYIFK